MGAESAENIAQRVLEAFGSLKTEPTPEQVEAVLRPIADISSETDEKVSLILCMQGKLDLSLWVGPWFEANIMVSGKGEDREKTIEMFLTDICDCVIDHLPAAVAHASDSVDPRVAQFMPQKKKE